MASYISRAQWGGPGDFIRADGGGAGAYVIARSARSEFFVHHDGGAPCGDVDPAEAMLAMQRAHLAVEGGSWGGIGYNFVVFQDGSTWEGRGWDLSAVACPDHNESGFHVQVHIGGDEQPTAAALAAVRALYDEACSPAVAGHPLAMRGHRDGFPTECPGSALYAWVQAGMPHPIESQEDDDMATLTPDNLAQIAEAVWAADWPVQGGRENAGLRLGQARNASRETLAQVAALTAAVRVLADARGIDPARVEQAVREAVAHALDGATVTLDTKAGA